jgi:hypothetical protein
LRGSRAKALRRLFKAEYGRLPNDAEWKLMEDGKGWDVTPSEMRRLKNAWKKTATTRAS